ncbi:MAG: hypothetical protein M3P08_04895 [Thermoproteota archaeon]|nr:hypothetical protein [Thermoproteota archaeon]
MQQGLKLEAIQSVAKQIMTKLLIETIPKPLAIKLKIAAAINIGIVFLLI